MKILPSAVHLKPANAIEPKFNEFRDVFAVKRIVFANEPAQLVWLDIFEDLLETNYYIDLRLTPLIELFNMNLNKATKRLRESTDLTPSELAVLEKIEFFGNKTSELVTKVSRLTDKNYLTQFNDEYEQLWNLLMRKDFRFEKDSLDIVNDLMRVVEEETDIIAGDLFTSLGEIEAKRNEFIFNYNAVRVQVERINDYAQQTYWSTSEWRRASAFKELNRLTNELIVYFEGDLIEAHLNDIATDLDELDDIQMSLPEKIRAFI